jgi:4-amino-4-deoxy-L-arabinose transferase-like glycosyltransferase
LSGALELLLVTPLSIKQILAGQRRALWRHFRVTLFIILLLFPVLIWHMNRQSPNDPVDGVIFVGNMVVLLADFHALGWVGMWAGLRTRHHRAVLVTLLQIMVVPWLLYFVLGVAGFFNSRSPVPLFVISLVRAGEPPASPFLLLPRRSGCMLICSSESPIRMPSSRIGTPACALDSLSSRRCYWIASAS